MKHVMNQLERSGRLRRGFSVVELLVVMAVTSVILIIILSMIEEATRLSLFVESRNDLSVMAQRPVNQIQRELLQANNIFFESVLGTPYRVGVHGALVAADPQPVPVSLLPQDIPIGAMGPDTAGTRDTGNALMLARKLSPFRITLNTETVGGVTYPTVIFFADRYVFHYYYLSYAVNRPRAFRNAPYIINLYRFRSRPVADYFQLTNATANLGPGQITALSTALRGNGALQADLDYAWDPGQPFGSSFYTIPAPGLTFGAVIANPNAVNPRCIARRDVVPMIPELQGGRISGMMPITIGYRYNNELLDPFYTDQAEAFALTGRGRVQLPRFGNVNDLADCGFEVKIVGPQGSRQVMTRLVMYSNYAVTKLDAQEGLVISSFTRRGV